MATTRNDSARATRSGDINRYVTFICLTVGVVAAALDATLGGFAPKHWFLLAIFACPTIVCAGVLQLRLYFDRRKDHWWNHCDVVSRGDSGCDVHADVNINSWLFRAWRHARVLPRSGERLCIVQGQRFPAFVLPRRLRDGLLPGRKSLTCFRWEPSIGATPGTRCGSGTGEELDEEPEVRAPCCVL